MPNRNMIYENNTFFSRLFAYSKVKGVEILNPDKGRYLKFLNEYSELEKRLLISGQVNVFRVHSKFLVTQISNGDDCFYGALLPSDISEDVAFGIVSPHANLTSVFMLSVTNADATPISSASEIKDCLEDFYIGAGGYIGHDLEHVIELFQDFICLVQSAGDERGREIGRVAGLLAISLGESLPANFSEHLKTALSDLFLNGNKYVPFGRLTRSMFSFSHDGIFLELYRCLEALFCAPMMLELTKEWPSARPHIEIVELLERNISWRPTEANALSNLIKCCDAGTAARICSIINKNAECTESEKNIFQKCGESIYSVRNKIVHYRPLHRSFAMEESDWNLLNAEMCSLVKVTYEKYGETFHG